VRQAPPDKEKEVADSKAMLVTLIHGMKSVLYSISAYGNTVIPQRPLPQGAPSTFGLREDEISVAVTFVTAGLPCLRLFSEIPGFPGTAEQQHDPYQTFADVFTVLQVRAHRAFSMERGSDGKPWTVDGGSIPTVRCQGVASIEEACSRVPSALLCLCLSLWSFPHAFRTRPVLHEQ
jgi:hypothetical protein